MNARQKITAAVAALACAGAGFVIGVTTSASASGTCNPATTRCVSGALQVQDPWSDNYPRNQLSVSDKSNAPMFWVNVGGAWSGGEPFCVTNLKVQPVICLGGPVANNKGQPVVTWYVNGKPSTTLTKADVDWIHRHGG